MRYFYITWQIITSKSWRQIIVLPVISREKMARTIPSNSLTKERRHFGGAQHFTKNIVKKNLVKFTSSTTPTFPWSPSFHEKCFQEKSRQIHWLKSVGITVEPIVSRKISLLKSVWIANPRTSTYCLNRIKLPPKNPKKFTDWIGPFRSLSRTFHEKRYRGIAVKFNSTLSPDFVKSDSRNRAVTR